MAVICLFCRAVRPADNSLVSNVRSILDRWHESSCRAARSSALANRQRDGRESERQAYRLGLDKARQP